MEEKWQLATRIVQGGYTPRNGETRVLPIYQSTPYKFDDAEELAKLFDLEKSGHMYSRISNPTVEAFENKINQLERGVGAVATASGQSATMLALLNICQAGEHILASQALYGGTYTLLDMTFRKLGIKITFVDPLASQEEIEAQVQPNTRALMAETIGNPGLGVLDFAKFSQVAKNKNIPLIVDNTFATPYLCRPFEHGANIIVHSTTKYIDGHGTSVGGIIIDGGNFDWSKGNFPELTEPDPSYHGLKYWDKFGRKAYITKARVTLLRDMGPAMSPFNAFLSNLGAETLHLRMEKHSENALNLAQFLENHEKVAWVNYPGLKSNSTYYLAEKYLSQGASGILTFGVKGGVEGGKIFINNIKLANLLVHVGDIRTCVLHPATMTHRQLTEEQQLACGVTPDLIRVSVGIEDIRDIMADFDQALAKVIV